MTLLTELLTNQVQKSVTSNSHDFKDHNTLESPALQASYLIGSGFNKKFKASVRTCSVKGGLSPLRWMSRCAELQSACTPVSVRLEMHTDTSFTGFSLRTAS